MMAGGVLWRLGDTNFLPTLTSLLAGDFLADIAWYAIGRFAGRRAIMRWGRLIHLSARGVEKIEVQLRTRYKSLLAVSKVSGGFGISAGTLMMAGVMRIPFGLYCVIELLGGVLWVSAMMLVGYLFGNVIAGIPLAFQVAISLCGFLLFVLVLSIVGSYFSREAS